MIFDSHVHIATPEAMAAYGPPFQSCASLYARTPLSDFYGRPDLSVSLEDTFGHLQECGVVGAVIANVDASFRWKNRFSNENMVEAIAPYGDFFKPFASVDPRLRRTAVAELRRAFAELGCVGFKVHPSYQEVYPNDRELMYPLYEVCLEFDAPVLFHTGSTRLYPAPIKYSQPLHLDEVAIDFPDVKVIMAHWGWPWVEEALAIVWRNENIYVDLSGHLPQHLPPVVWHYMQLPDLRDRFFFGSDYPFLKPGRILKAYEDFDQWHCPLCNRIERWKDGVKDKLLGENFLKLIRKER